ncbi:MAG: aryldialkylphosphatase [Streptosporangiaceae bacterium]
MTTPSGEPRIRTVTGSVPVTAISGPVLAHEHLRVDLRWPVTRPSNPRRFLDEELHVAAELNGLRKDHGLGLVVELTCMGMGRDASSLSRLSAGSRVAVVAATGFFCDPFHPAFTADLSVDRLAERLLAEIGFGLDGTSALPGVIGEIGSWGEAPSPVEERTLRAAALAAVESDLPVATCGRPGLAQLEILTAAGLDPSRIAVGQQDPLEDPAAHRKIAEAGAYVSFGMLGRRPGGLRPALELIEAGYADRLLLSSGVSRMEHLAHYGGTGYGHLFGAFLPALREAGVDEDTITLMTHDNVLRWLAGS